MSLVNKFTHALYPSVLQSPIGFKDINHECAIRKSIRRIFSIRPSACRFDNSLPRRVPKHMIKHSVRHLPVKASSALTAPWLTTENTSYFPTVLDNCVIKHYGAKLSKTFQSRLLLTKRPHPLYHIGCINIKSYA